MGELKIRAVRSESEELESRFAVIDTFEDVEKGKAYFCGCEVFETDFKSGMTIRGKVKNKLCLDFRDSYDCMDACDDDVFEKVDIPLYLGLSQALKNKGYIFNKKLARLYKNPRIKRET